MHTMIFTLFTLGCSPEIKPISSLSAGVNEFTLQQEVAGTLVERRFVVHTAADLNDAENTPLLFAFHGNGGLADSYVEELGPIIEEGNFIGVYPEGMAYSWNLGPEESEADDVAFTESILAMLNGTKGVDSSKPVAMGFSNGAGMVHELAMESDKFVAIAPQASQMLANKTPAVGAANVSVLQLSGTEDGLVPYNGGVGVMEHDFLAAEASTSAWAVHNQCNDDPAARSSGPYQIIEWENCSSSRRVVHVRMNDVGHDLPMDIEGGTMAYIMNFLSEARQ